MVQQWSKKDRLSRMLINTTANGKSGVVRFKYYGEFDTMKKIYNECKDDLKYIGNSNIDGSPVFVYYYDIFTSDEVHDIDKLSKRIRTVKIKHYIGKEMTDKEKSVFTFFKFFIVAYDNYDIKGLSEYEIRSVSYIEK